MYVKNSKSNIKMWWNIIRISTYQLRNMEDLQVPSDSIQGWASLIKVILQKVNILLFLESCNIRTYDEGMLVPWESIQDVSESGHILSILSCWYISP